jgi:hypothetical protein
VTTVVFGCKSEPTPTPAVENATPIEVFYLGGESSATEPDEELEATVTDFHTNLIELFREGVDGYPVPVARERLRDIIRAFDAGELVIATLARSEQSDFYSALDHTPDGRPMMIFFYEDNMEVLRAFLEREEYRNNDEAVGLFVGTWFVSLAIHEWYHHTLNHSCYDVNTTDEAAIEAMKEQESEAWWNTMRDVVVPARDMGFLPIPPTVEYGYAFVGYTAAAGDPSHPAWQAFLNWLIADGPIEALDPYIEQFRENHRLTE